MKTTNLLFALSINLMTTCAFATTSRIETVSTDFTIQVVSQQASKDTQGKIGTRNKLAKYAAFKKATVELENLCFGEELSSTDRIEISDIKISGGTRAFVGYSYTMTVQATCSSVEETGSCSQTANAIDRHQGESIKSPAVQQIISGGKDLKVQILTPKTPASGDFQSDRLRILVNDQAEILSALCN